MVTRLTQLSQRTGMSKDELKKLLGKVGDVYDIPVPGDLRNNWGGAVVSVRDHIKTSGVKYTAIQIVGGDSVVPFGEYQNPAWKSGTTSFDPWILSDDWYGDLDVNGSPEVLVARLPDGGSSAIIKKQFGSPPGQATVDSGFVYTTQNSLRVEVGDKVKGLIGAGSNRFTSPPKKYPKDPVGFYGADKDQAFFLLHGSFMDTSLWWGESKVLGLTPQAFHRSEANDANGVFSAACYGAYIGEREYRGQTGQNFFGYTEKMLPARSTPYAPDESISLSFLATGADYFVGSTGVSYTDPDANAGCNYTLASTFYDTVSSTGDPLKAAFEAKAAARKMKNPIPTKMSRQYIFLGLVPVKYWKASASGAVGEGATSIVMDVSDSMTEDVGGGGTKIDQARESAQDVVDIIEGISAGRGEAVQVGVAAFSDDAFEVLPVTTDYAEAKSKIANLSTKSMTNLKAAIEQGTAQLDGIKGPKAMILLSDGMDTVGNDDDAIMQAVAEAKDAGITIFTIGFGEQGSLDWDLLEQIADETGGTASLVDPTDRVALGKVFIRSQVQATDEILGEFEGTVAQGETVEAGSIKVTDQATDMQAILYWPGSQLEMQLTDPSGSLVTSGYPGFTLVRDTTPAQLFIKNPKVGEWKVGVFGKETSMDNEPYYALLSSRESSAPALSGGGGVTTSDGSMLMLVFLGIVGAGVVGALVLRQSGSSTPAIPGSEKPVSAMHLVDASGRQYALGPGANTVGRAPESDIALDDPTVSREHAVIAIDGSTASVRDSRSTQGTSVNGRRVKESPLTNGDKVSFGKTELRFVNPPSRITNL